MVRLRLGNRCKRHRKLVLESLEQRHLLFGFFDDGTLALEATNPAGVIEPPVPIHHNGALIDGANHQVVEAFDQVPGTSDFPLTFVDLVANTFLRATYQTEFGGSGATGALGTSFVGSPSFRTDDGSLQYVPTVTRGDVNTDGTPRYESIVTAEFTGLSEVTSTRRFPDPAIGATSIDVDISFEATGDIDLAAGAPFSSNDRFRVATLSSMFSSSTEFDANVIRYEDHQGIVQTISLTDATPRGQHLLPIADEIGSWVELIKTEGSTWFPSSPTTRVEILDDDGLQLGLQGFLDSSMQTSDDSLSVWLEIIDAGDTISNGANFDVSVQVTATPPQPLDFGDAPDPLIDDGRYPTRLESDGARHFINALGPILGQIPPDAEPNAQQGEQNIPIVNAGFDELQVSSSDGTPLVLAAGQFTIGLGDTTVRTLSDVVGPAFVPGWSAILGSESTRGISHPNSLFTPELNADDYALFAQGPTGIAEQVLSVSPQPNTVYTLTVDLGDQNFLNFDPNPLVSLVVDGIELAGGNTSFVPPANGAFSTLTRTYVTGDAVPDGDLAIRLGSTSGFFNGQVYYNNVGLTMRSASSDGDDNAGVDDEDGLLQLRGQNTGNGRLLPGDSYTAIVEVAGAGFLNAFADFNGDGDWEDEHEQIADDIPFDTTTGPNQIEIQGTVPADAVLGPSVLRLRVDSDGGLTSLGLADDGEVEDHQFHVVDCGVVVTNTSDSGLGSLREAIGCANNTSGIQTIEFRLPADDPNHVYYQDDGVDADVTLANITATSQNDDANIIDIDPDWPHSWWMISPQSALPLVTEAVVIDGYTQVGSSANTNPVGQGLDSVLRIEINGQGAGDLINGLLQMRTDGSIVQGLVINRTAGPKIRLDNFSDSPDGNTVIAGNFIGPDVSGTKAFDPPQPQGVVIDVSGVSVRGSANNVIGGTTAADRNLISGNNGALAEGVRIEGALADGNRVAGNLIGTDRNGVTALPNMTGINTGSDSMIGGTDPSAANLISGNVEGVRTQGRRSTVRGNQIGTDVSGQLPLGNTQEGVVVPINSSDHQILENTIAFNATGVLVDSGSLVGNGNLISRNSIFSNGGGIDLANGGDNNDVPPVSDPPDQDVGPNGLQNYPVLSSVTDLGAMTRIEGTLQSTPNSDFRIEFFANTERLQGEFDGGAFAEGRTFVGTIDVATDANGLAAFTADVDPLPGDQPFVTATATDITDDGSGPRNNTSQFSLVEPLGGCNTTVTTTADSGLGTLREAIVCANLTAGAQVIDFAIPVNDAQHLYYRDDGVDGEVAFDNIAVTSAADDANIVDIDPDWPHSWFGIILDRELPEIIETVTIDGYTQPGASENTVSLEDDSALDTVLKIEIDGRNVDGDGFRLDFDGTNSDAAGSVIRGFAINSFGGDGIQVNTLGGGNTIAGNFLGSDISGTLNFGNDGNGVFLVIDDDDTIGGPDPGDRNLISGNATSEIEILSGTGGIIQGNLLGMDRTGHAAFVSPGPLVFISNDDARVPQRPSSFRGNLPAYANRDPRDDYRFDGNKSRFTFAEGFKDAYVTAAGFGVSLSEPNFNFTKKTSELTADAIEKQNKVFGNRPSVSQAFSSNSGSIIEPFLLVDLQGDGVTPNDLLDADDGPNGLQNFPVLTHAMTDAGVTTVAGTLHSVPNTSFRVEIYSSSYNTNVVRAGENSLGTINVATDSNGDSIFNFISPELVPPGHFVTSVATRLEDNTLEPIESSEFSDGLAVPGPLDFGDAPDTYGTSHLSPFAVFGGARHAPTGVTLGSQRDAELDAVGPLDGMSDDGPSGSVDDEDGVDFGTSGAVLPVGQSVPIEVDIQNSAGDARLYAWLDFNGDGDFLDDGEQIANGANTFANLGDGMVTLNVTAPDTGFGGTSYARFRVSTDANLDFDGQAGDGEIEDYRITIAAGGLFIVGSTGDGGDSDTSDHICDDGSGNCTLRAAIQQANATANVAAGPDVIVFDLSGVGPHVITPATALPDIGESLIIDGTRTSSASPVIQIDGGGTLVDGLRVTGGGSTISGLSITGFTDSGIEFVNAGGNTASRNFLGIDPSGVADGNLFGVRLQVSPNNTLSNNVISGNDRAGVFITGVGASGNIVSHNRIGTDPSGMSAVPNGTDGITIFAPDNQIVGNQISGNRRWGAVTKFAHATGNLIDHNQIGVDATGIASLDNLTGVTLQSGSNLVTSNVISGNRAYGVSLSMAGSIGNTIEGNLVGTDRSGTLDVGNSIVGVRATNGSANVVRSNTISGNNGFGVLLALGGTTGNQIIDNKIGTDQSGNVAVPNSDDGVRVVQGANNNTVRENLISGNRARAVAVDGPTTIDNVIDNNQIGVDATLTAPLHNGIADAVRITAPDTAVTANLISAATTGILVFRPHATGNRLESNMIGGSASLGMIEGVRIIGGAANNVVTDNDVSHSATGVLIGGTGQGNRVTANRIFANSVIGIDLDGDGVTANDAGDADAGANRLQNTAVLSLVQREANGNLTINYAVDSSVSNSSYDLTIEFFLSDGNHQGQTLIGTDTYAAAQAGQFKSLVLTPSSPVGEGQQVVATVTDALGNTSEFSLQFTVTSA